MDQTFFPTSDFYSDKDAISSPTPSASPPQAPSPSPVLRQAALFVEAIPVHGYFSPTPAYRSGSDVGSHAVAIHLLTDVASQSLCTDNQAVLKLMYDVVGAEKKSPA